MDNTEDGVSSPSQLVEPERRSWFERTVRILDPVVRIVVPVAIPVVLAVIGAQISRSVATMDVQQKYVELAVTLLANEGSDTDQELRAWAVDILQEYAPIPLNPETAQRLKTGDIVLGCADECSYYGQERWLDDSHYQFCGNYDCYICLEWSEPIYSPQGQEPSESP